jgi:hypothetical protein
MSTKEKLIERFKSLPSDFSFDELVRLFGFFGFELDNKGATSGSRVEFIKESESFMLHKPHPGNIIKRYCLRAVFNYLKQKELL